MRKKKKEEYIINKQNNLNWTVYLETENTDHLPQTNNKHDYNIQNQQTWQIVYSFYMKVWLHKQPH